MIQVFVCFSVKGWNWGNTDFKGSVLTFEVSNKDAFEIPLSYVSACTNTKNEVIIAGVIVIYWVQGKKGKRDREGK